MGNSEHSHIKPIQPSHFQHVAEMKKAQKEPSPSEVFSTSRELNSYYSSVVHRIYAQPLQSHLKDIMNRLETNEKLTTFIDEVHNANIEILDSFYEHIVSASRKEVYKQSGTGLNIELGLCGSNLVKKEIGQMTNKNVDITDLTLGTEAIQHYEIYKEVGLNVIKKQESKYLVREVVCFIILAGGKNMRYDLYGSKECDPLRELPSQSTLIEMMLKKLEALGRLIDTPIKVFVMVSDEEKKKRIRKIKTTKISNPDYLTVDFLTQVNYGCLDRHGGMVVTNTESIYMHPNGSGDIWANFYGKNYEAAGLNKYKYISIMGVSNLLEHCFDCFMIGKLVSEEIPWVTMSSLGKNNNCPFFYEDGDEQLQIIDPETLGFEEFYNPNKVNYEFMNHSVLSMEFIQRVVNSNKWSEFNRYRCKEKKINFRPPLSTYDAILTFEREMADIFTFTSYLNKSENKDESEKGYSCGHVQEKQGKKGAILVMDSQEFFSPFYSQSDKTLGVILLSRKFKNWLKISKGKIREKLNELKEAEIEEELEKICEIDPFISLEGENLEEMIQDLEKMSGNIEYPFYIAPEEGEPHSDFATPIKESRFEKLNQFTTEL